MNKKIYIIIGLLVAATLAVASIPFLTLSQKEENKTDNKGEEPNVTEDNKQNYAGRENSVKLNSISSESGKIVQKFDVIINEKKGIFEIEYTGQINEDYGQVLGKIPESNTKFSIVSTDENLSNFLSDNFNERKVHDYVTEDDFKFLKGEDGKAYLLFLFKTYHFVAGYSDYLYVYNEDLKLVTGDVNYNGCDNDEAFTIRTQSSGHFSEEEPGKSGYKDVENFLGYRDVDSYLNLKVEGNKIYYLKALQNVVSTDNFGTLEERVYTIKDDKLEYTVKNSFVIKDAAGMAC